MGMEEWRKYARGLHMVEDDYNTCWREIYEEGSGCSCNECSDKRKIAAERPEEKKIFFRFNELRLT